MDYTLAKQLKDAEFPWFYSKIIEATEQSAMSQGRKTLYVNNINNYD